MANLKQENRMKELVSKLNLASYAYYNKEAFMLDEEFDALLKELSVLEDTTGIILPNSPTQKVGAPVIKGLQEIKHEYPALSLDKTKDVAEYVTNLKKNMLPERRKFVLMWKMDGSTVQATYKNGKLVMLATRGDGEVGNVILHNAHVIKGLPIRIPYKGNLTVRGEAVMSHAEFDRIQLEVGTIYKNARNLANATLKIFDSNEASKRDIHLKAFNLVYRDDIEEIDSFTTRLDWLENQGFEVVDHEECDIDELSSKMEAWKNRIALIPYPVDGYVTAYDNVVYASTLEGTNHHPNHMIGYAFKWQDTQVETTLRQIEYSPSVNSLNPVAVFDSVELEGTTVSRASLHNLSYLLDKDLKIGDKITVYKANMIIPQVARNKDATREYNNDYGAYDDLFERHDIPHVCPVCGAPTAIEETGDTITEAEKEELEKDGITVVPKKTLTLTCTNPDCTAKKLKRFSRFVQKGCMNIKGISEETICKFIENGFLKEFADFYKLSRYEKDIVSMEGFGTKSYKKLIDSIEVSRKTDFVSLVNALGIPNIGKGQAKILAKEYNGNVLKFFNDVYNRHDFTHIEGIGEVLHYNLLDWGNEYLGYIPFEKDNTFPSEVNVELFNLLKELDIEIPQQKDGTGIFDGKTFVITGKLEHFENRDALVSKIESLGGKASGSVSAKTNYLINNDVESTSGKNKKAKELGIPVISEEDFINMIGE